VNRCSPLVSKLTCDAAQEGSDLSCEWKVNTRICFQGKKWKKVKSLPYDSATWYSTTDHLKGTDVVGTGLDDSVQWSKAFSTETYDTFLFASGDFSIWLQALVTEVGPEVIYNRSTPRNVINSSSSSTAYTSDWDNSLENYSPEIQLNQRSSANADYNWLYRAGSDASNKNVWQSRGGNYVFINSGI
jgi:hypothetical protein